MKILCLADRPSRTSLKELIDENEIELFIALGDLDRFELYELENIDYIPKIGVYGNHCSGDYFEPLGIQNLHLRTFDYSGIVFGGFEGSIRYKESKYAKMYTQEEADEMLRDFPPVDVLIAHSPPFGVNDEPDSSSHQGFYALERYISDKRPRYFLHGHTYPSSDAMITKYLSTEIIYVHKDKIIEI